METRHRIANQKEILKANREAVKKNRENARQARQEINMAMLDIAMDPARGHLRYSQIGRLYVEMQRFTHLADFSHGVCLTLRAEIKRLEAQLANE